MGGMGASDICVCRIGVLSFDTGLVWRTGLLIDTVTLVNPVSDKRYSCGTALSIASHIFG